MGMFFILLLCVGILGLHGEIHRGMRERMNRRPFRSMPFS